MKLLSYVEDTWIASSSRTPASWTTFKRAVRTNNDVEGWHQRLLQDGPPEPVPAHRAAAERDVPPAPTGLARGTMQVIPGQKEGESPQTRIPTRPMEVV